MKPLNDRQRIALAALAELTDPAPMDPPYHELPKRRAYAFKIEDAMRKADLPFKRSRSGAANGAANTLVALKRRGLASKALDGCYVQAQWWITPAGLEALGGA